MTWRRAAVIAAGTLVLVLALLPVDGMVLELTKRFQPGRDLALGGDLKRELEFVQQFGDVVCLAIVGAAIVLLDPGARRRLLDGLAAVLATAAGYEVLKIGIGRLRPKFGEPLHFLGPFGTQPFEHGGVVVARHSWEVWGGISSDLWSMPSSHTAAATALAVILARMYPRLTPLVVVLAVLVGCCRVIFAAHYPSDVAAGWGLGIIAAGLAMEGRWGQRVFARSGGPGGVG